MAIDPKSREKGLRLICITVAFSPFTMSPSARANSIAALALPAFTTLGRDSRQFQQSQSHEISPRPLSAVHMSVS
jgi:hypothetical protein